MTEALYLKYRPQQFADVIGQPNVVRSLKSLLAKGTNHTVMLSGPSGTGKTTLARIAAKTLEYDIVEIDAATFTGIDDMREVTRSLQYRPLGQNKGKAIIIDECHALSKAAWQSLLKSLEEPPSWVIWFLRTTDAAKVPTNIQTRCTKYDLKPVSIAELTEWLDQIVRTEQAFTKLADDVVDSLIQLRAKEAQGSPRAALVNLGACLTAKTKADALDLLKSASESSEAVELARALVNGTNWAVCKELLATLKDSNPESVRHVVRSYVTKVLLGNGRNPEKNFAILEAFSQPFPSSDGVSPLVLAVGRLLLA